MGMSKKEAGYTGQKEVSIVPQYDADTVEAYWRPSNEEPVKVATKVAEEARIDQESLPSTKLLKRLSKQEREYLGCASAYDLEVVYETYLRQATERQSEANAGTIMSLRVERSTTKFLERFHGYVKAYSGVIQLMNGAGANYGDAAYGALSMFLVVGGPGLDSTGSD